MPPQQPTSRTTSDGCNRALAACLQRDWAVIRQIQAARQRFQSRIEFKLLLLLLLLFCTCTCGGEWCVACDMWRGTHSTTFQVTTILVVLLCCRLWSWAKDVRPMLKVSPIQAQNTAKERNVPSACLRSLVFSWAGGARTAHSWTATTTTGREEQGTGRAAGHSGSLHP